MHKKIGVEKECLGRSSNYVHHCHKFWHDVRLCEISVQWIGLSYGLSSNSWPWGKNMQHHRSHRQHDCPDPVPLACMHYKCHPFLLSLSINSGGPAGDRFKVRAYRTEKIGDEWTAEQDKWPQSLWAKSPCEEQEAIWLAIESVHFATSREMLNWRTLTLYEKAFLWHSALSVSSAGFFPSKIENLIAGVSRTEKEMGSKN